VSRVYVAVRGPHQQVPAYYASSAGAFLRDHLPPDDQAGLPSTRCPRPTLVVWPSICPAEVSVWANCFCSTS
jgi:hypothetical protein